MGYVLSTLRDAVYYTYYGSTEEMKEFEERYTEMQNLASTHTKMGIGVFEYERPYEPF